jgi:hypothetical protein
MEGGRITSLTADTVALIGDLHGDLRALVKILREVGCFRAAPAGSPRTVEREAWEALDVLCSRCPVGRKRTDFPEPERLRAIQHMGGARDGRSVVFCGDVIDNRRPGVAGDDSGFGICAYSDSVELVIETVARLCRESTRGAVTWLLGNHDVWPFLSSCHECPNYAPHHQCARDGSYSKQFRRKLITALIYARAQAAVVANNVLCCHGGINVAFVQDVVRRVPQAPTEDNPRALVVRTINQEFDNLLHVVAASADARLTRAEETGRFGWCLAPHALLWCRPQTNPEGFDQVFEPQSYRAEADGGAPGIPLGWEPLAASMAAGAYCVAHTMQRHGVTIAHAGNCGAARTTLMRQDARVKLQPMSLLSVDTGQSRGFGATNRVVQTTRVSADGHVHVSRNLV